MDRSKREASSDPDEGFSIRAVSSACGSDMVGATALFLRTAQRTQPTQAEMQPIAHRVAKVGLDCYSSMINRPLWEGKQSAQHLCRGENDMLYHVTFTIDRQAAGFAETEAELTSAQAKRV